MTLTFISPEWAKKFKNLWKANHAPCYLKKTSDPCIYSVVFRRGVESIVGQLFIVYACFADTCHKRMTILLLRKYSQKEKNRILNEVKKYDFIIEKEKLMYEN